MLHRHTPEVLLERHAPFGTGLLSLGSVLDLANLESLPPASPHWPGHQRSAATPQQWLHDDRKEKWENVSEPKALLKTAESPLSWSIFNCTIDIRWPGLLSLGLLIIHVWPTCFQCRAGRKPSRTKIDAPSSCSSVIPRLALQTAAQHELYFSQ